MDNIFAPGTPERDRLESIAALMSEMSPNGWHYHVQDVPKDLSPATMWTTIFCVSDDGMMEYQIFLPHERDEIMSGDLVGNVERYFASSDCLDKGDPNDADHSDRDMDHPKAKPVDKETMDRYDRAREELQTYAPDELIAIARYKERRANETTPNAEGVHVGDIYYGTWGWEQTNVDFYQVVGLKGAHTIEVCELEQRCVETVSMQGICRAIRDAFVPGAKRHTLRTKCGFALRSPRGHGNLYLDNDGDGHSFSTYA